MISREMTLDEFKNDFNNNNYIFCEFSFFNHLREYIKTNYTSYKLKEINLYSSDNESENVNNFLVNSLLKSISDESDIKISCHIFIDPITRKMNLIEVEQNKKSLS